MKQATRATLVTLSCLACAAAAPAGELARIDGLEPGQIELRGFVLGEAQEVEIEAVGFDRGDDEEHDNPLTEAWILDAATREVVWSMNGTRPEERHRNLREHSTAVRLGAGTYEVYYATYPDLYKTEREGHDEAWWEKIGRSLGRTFDTDWGDFERALRHLRIAVDGRGRALGSGEVEAARERLAGDALVALFGRDDDEVQSRGFELDEPAEVFVYAVGEVQKDGGYDYGWILDTRSRERLWTFTFEDSEPGGGAFKNRTARETLRLPAGRYAAFYVTDDSHSAGSWNTLPPHDPSYWGLVVRVAGPEAGHVARTFDYRHFPGDEQIIAELVRLHDGDHRSQSFTIDRPLQIRVYALGEGLERSGMVDSGRILDARTRREVWSMGYERTEHGGGGQKNRQIDEVIRLEPGSYVVSFATDSSHSYEGWNASPPLYQERWGISLFAVDEDFDPSQVGDYREDEDSELLVRIARVRDGSHRRRDFSLEKESRLALYALGEGQDGRMYDYGWIEDARTGRRVWEMEYGETELAGGAKKNRLYQGVLTLQAGEYTAHYETDDSHSFRDWNDAPPHDPEGWGIRIAFVD